ncbi:MAG: hypothetical protein ACJAVI_000013 [Candidatus Azotimanducaceae bacterium]|jgi:hypothetical protein
MPVSRDWLYSAYVTTPWEAWVGASETISLSDIRLTF